MKPWKLWVTILLFAVYGAVGSAAPGEIKVGKWSGYLKIDGASDALALSMDAFIVRPDPRSDFQILKLLFKIDLGGYGSTEYETELFEDPPYDWDQNILTLDDSHNEIVAQVTIQKALKPIMEGKVFIRNSVPPATGYMRLQYRADGPVDFVEPTKLTPSLAGQYEGQCGRTDAVLQVETAKGLTKEMPVPTAGLHHYNISAGLGLADRLCSFRWCVDRGYSEGTYDFYQRRLYLEGSRRSDECKRDGEELTCPLRFANEPPQECKLKKVNATLNNRIKIYPRAYSLRPTPDQLLPLPKMNPPASADLVAALKGSFFGYLHHESRDRYQPVVLSVVASTSSENPHIQNDVFISASAVPFFGDKIVGPTMTYPFDRRIAYFAPPGYMLESKDSDVFLIVQEWKKGFMSGVWFSKLFGRVGTFEAVKGTDLPPLDSSAKRLAGIGGTYRGPEGQASAWEIKTLVPKQPKGYDRSYLVFQSEHSLILKGGVFMGLWSTKGSYDLYTGALSFSAHTRADDESRLVTGFLEEPDRWNLFWPGARFWGVGIQERSQSDYPRIAQ